jgi:hypothetical protein
MNATFNETRCPLTNVNLRIFNAFSFFYCFKIKLRCKYNSTTDVDRGSFDRNSVDRNYVLSVDRNFHNQLTEIFETFHLIE